MVFDHKRNRLFAFSVLSVRLHFNGVRSCSYTSTASGSCAAPILMANIPPNDPVVDTKLSPTLNDSHDDDAHSDKESQVASNDAHSTPTVRSDTTPVPPRIPYSIYSSRQKWTIALLATSVGMFSPLGANIYFPAIPSLSDAFHRTVQDIK